MTRECQVCYQTKDIMEFYIARRNKWMPERLCKECAEKRKTKKKLSPLEILVRSGYTTEQALNIINQGL